MYCPIFSRTCRSFPRALLLSKPSSSLNRWCRESGCGKKSDIIIVIRRDLFTTRIYYNLLVSIIEVTLNCRPGLKITSGVVWDLWFYRVYLCMANDDDDDRLLLFRSFRLDRWFMAASPRRRTRRPDLDAFAKKESVLNNWFCEYKSKLATRFKCFALKPENLF